MSCQVERTVKTEIWTTHSITKQDYNEESIRELHFKIDGTLYKEIHFDISNSGLKTETLYDSGGNKLEETRLSREKNGIKAIYEYLQDDISMIKTFQIENGKPLDTLITTKIDSINQNGLKVSSMILSESVFCQDTSIVKYYYNAEGLLKQKNIFREYGDSITEYFKYNLSNEITNHKLDFSKYDLVIEEISFYSDSILNKVITIENNDTTAIKLYNYLQRKKSRIVCKKPKINKTEVTVIKYKYW